MKWNPEHHASGSGKENTQYISFTEKRLQNWKTALKSAWENDFIFSIVPPTKYLQLERVCS